MKRSTIELAHGPGALVDDRYETVKSEMLQDTNGKHPGGRPSKRTAKITEQIFEGISYGLTDEEVAALVGIDDSTFTRWKKDPEFCRAIKKAQATRLLIRLKRIEKAESGWQGTAWAMDDKTLSALDLRRHGCAGKTQRTLTSYCGKSLTT